MNFPRIISSKCKKKLDCIVPYCKSKSFLVVHTILLCITCEAWTRQLIIVVPHAFPASDTPPTWTRDGNVYDIVLDAASWARHDPCYRTRHQGYGGGVEKRERHALVKNTPTSEECIYGGTTRKK